MTRTLSYLSCLGLTFTLIACSASDDDEFSMPDGGTAAAPVGGSGPGTGAQGAGAEGAGADGTGATGVGGDGGVEMTPPVSVGGPAFSGDCCKGGTNIPFGAHLQSYPEGTAFPSGTPQEIDARAAGFYDAWKEAHLFQGCGGYFVEANSTFDERLTVSEAMGYGMVITAYMAGHDPDAQAIFDGLYGTVQRFPSPLTPGLMAWAIEGSATSCYQAADGESAATDGDLDIAYALLLADRQWGSCGAVNYLAEAKARIQAIQSALIGDGGGFLKLGDWVDPRWSGDKVWGTRSSDFMPGHLAAFEAANGGGAFSGVEAGTFGIFESIQTGGNILFPDFIVNVTTTPSPAPPNFLETANDGKYNANACRVPLRLGADYLTTGDARSRALLQPIDQWAVGTFGVASTAVRATYELDGSGDPNAQFYVPYEYLGPLGVAGMVGSQEGSQPWVNAVFDHLTNVGLNNSYYGDTVAMLSLVVMSGNWWAPDALVCN